MKIYSENSYKRSLGKQVLSELGMDRIWHPLLIRFGANTLKTFKQRSDGDPVLGDEDIFSSTWARSGKGTKVMQGRLSPPVPTRK